jgi:stearoyl-CoA desaturase (delta-9 desaturase)
MLVSQPQLQPWARQAPQPKASFWPAGFAGFLVFGWLLLIHATAALGLLLYPLPGLRLLLASALMAFLGGVSTTVCYHRALAHRSVKLNGTVRRMLILMALLSGQTPPRGWIATHRLHHATADTPADPSSPVWRGLWFAHIGWHWQANKRMRAGYANDLRGLEWKVWDLLLPAFFTASFFGGALFSPAAFFWLGAIRLVLVFHSTSLVNSICHTQAGVGPGEDCARNVWWVGPMQFLLGENWHRNHHRAPSLARFGDNWRQPDVGYLVIVSLEKIGLASEIRRPIGGRKLPATRGGSASQK